MGSPELPFSLSDLKSVVDISLRLTEHRHIQNQLRSLFRVDIELLDYEEEKHCFQIDMDGERDQSSSWPRYLYHMTDMQCDFVRRELPKIIGGAPMLRGLSLSGFHRVPGFYKNVADVMRTKQRIEQLYVEWKHLLDDVQDDQLLVDLFSSLETVSLDLRVICDEQAKRCGLFLESLKSLRSLSIKSGRSTGLVLPWIIPALGYTEKVQEVVWTGTMAGVSPRSVDCLCAALQKLPLKSLNLSWGQISSNQVQILLNGNNDIEELTLGTIDQPGVSVVEEFLRTNQTVSGLSVTLQHCDPAPILSGLKGHPSIARIALVDAAVSNATARMLKNMLKYNTSASLRSILIAICRSQGDFFHLLAEALSSTNGLEDFSLHGVPKLCEETAAPLSAAIRNNAALSRLTIGFGCSLSVQASEIICDSLAMNTNTKSLHLAGRVPEAALLPFANVLKHHNLDLTELTFWEDRVAEEERSFGVKQELDFLLQLNRLGGREFLLNPDFHHELMPLVLEKVTRNPKQQRDALYYIMRMKPELVPKGQE